jgi:hypothetical protein
MGFFKRRDLKIIVTGWPGDSADGDEAKEIECVMSVNDAEAELPVMMRCMTSRVIRQIEDPFHSLCGWTIHEIRILIDEEDIDDDDDENDNDENGDDEGEDQTEDENDESAVDDSDDKKIFYRHATVLFEEWSDDPDERPELTEIGGVLMCEKKI